MKKVIAALFLFSIAAWAAGPFDGTWKVDLSKTKASPRADSLIYKDGRFQCPTCIPKIDVKADGTDQPQAGSPYFDTIAIRIIDDKTVEFTHKKAGKVVTQGSRTLSPDGKFMTMNATSFPEGSEKPVTLRSKLIRVAAAPSGAHACSGSWREELQEASDNLLVFTIEGDDHGISLSTPTGESFTANFDGKDYPYKGNAGITSVSLRRIDARTFEETDKRNGKAIAVSTYKISSDGSTMEITSRDPRRNTTDVYITTKQ